MVFQMIDDVDKKPRYIKKYGGLVLLTKDPRGAEESIPQGWAVVKLKSGHLHLQKA
jgi:hypothetical protein